MTALVNVSLKDVRGAALALADRWAEVAPQLKGVYGIPRGGLVPAALVAGALGLELVDEPGPHVLVVDDLVDSGTTLARYLSPHRAVPVDALYRKPHAPAHLAPMAVEAEGWLVFPWEQGDESGGPTDAVVRLLNFVGEDPHREGLRGTPGRVTRALSEMTAGYQLDPADVLRTVFTEAHDQMVVLEAIDFTSLCEHHLLPFTGTATVGYVPRQRVVGLSKLARLVECFAARLQLQERLTDQIAGALMEHLAPAGAGAVVRARHSCMGCRGVRKPGAVMTTQSLRGSLLEDAATRAEFLGIAHYRA